MIEIINATASVLTDKVMKKKDKKTTAMPVCSHPNCETPVIRLGSFYCSVHTEGDSHTTTTTKEASFMNTLSTKSKDITTWVNNTYTTIKESKVVTYTITKVKALASLLGKKKTVIAIASASVTAAGLVTSGTCAAVAVGAGMATLTVVAARIMAKKKGEKLAYKAMLTDIGVAVATTAVLPFALFGLAYAGLFATVYGAILPYSIIVA